MPSRALPQSSARGTVSYLSHHVTSSYRSTISTLPSQSDRAPYPAPPTHQVGQATLALPVAACSPSAASGGRSTAVRTAARRSAWQHGTARPTARCGQGVQMCAGKDRSCFACHAQLACRFRLSRSASVQSCTPAPDRLCDTRHPHVLESPSPGLWQAFVHILATYAAAPSPRKAPACHVGVCSRGTGVRCLGWL